MSALTRFAGPLALTFALLGCSGGSSGSEVAGGSKDGTGANNGMTVDLVIPGSGGSLGGPNGTGGSGHSDEVIAKLPDGYVATDVGGYKLGAPIVPGMPVGGGGAGGAAPGNCGNILLGVTRDFKGADAGGHPDFNANIAGGDVTPNLVSMTLGMDRKPVYTSMCEIGNPMPAPICPYGAQTTSKANFDQWYNDTAGVNLPYLVSIFLAPQPNGLFTFQSLHYFPVDGAGFMDTAQADDGMAHNFSFTTELHTQFVYSGGENFRFQGDDDVWVFINNKLAVDLGGLHPAKMRNIVLDDQAANLGIKIGTIYPLDLFHAERHTTASTFRIDTNLAFTDCGTVIPTKVK